MFVSVNAFTCEADVHKVKIDGQHVLQEQRLHLRELQIVGCERILYRHRIGAFRISELESYFRFLQLQTGMFSFARFSNQCSNYVILGVPEIKNDEVLRFLFPEFPLFLCNLTRNDLNFSVETGLSTTST